MSKAEMWPRIVPFGLYMAFIAVADVAGRLGVEDSQLRWLYPLKVAAVTAALLYYRRHYAELAWRRLPLSAWAAALVAGVAVLVLWVNLDADWMTVGSSAGFDPRSNGQIDWLLVGMRIAGAALVVPLMEELFWRSFLMRWIANPAFVKQDPARVGIAAFAVTAVLFGVEHTLWLAGMVAGVVYGALYMRYRNVWVPVIAHGVTNGGLGAWVVATASWTYW